MRNKPNLPKAQMNLTSLIKVDYENIANCKLGENKPNTGPIKPNLLNAQMNVNKVLTKHYENVRLHGREKNKPNQTQSEILNQKSQIHSHPTGNKLHTPRRQSWGCFALSGRATPKTAGLAFSLVALRYYCRTTDKI